MPSEDDQKWRKRTELEEALCRYITHTLIYINIVRGFCEVFSIWIVWRDKEINGMMDIKERADKVDLSLSHVKKSEHKGKAFLEYLWSKMSQLTADSRFAELQNKLDEVLEYTLGGLEKFDCFLDAVEKLSVTSLHVFMENQVLHLPKDFCFKHVQAVITAARHICPLLLEFKTDAKVFFSPKLQNVEVLKYQLDRYMQTTKRICEKLEKSCSSDFCLKLTEKPVIDVNVDLSEDDIQRMLCHISHLHEIRKDQNFRTVFLFQGVSCSDFICEFNERQPRMLHFLEELEEAAVQLDKMKKGSKISSVAGSSVGVLGGVLSIVGLALVPVTAGVSLTLTMAGVGLGVTSTLNSAVTTAAEVGVNHKQQKKASEAFQSFMEDVQSLQSCLEEVTNQPDQQVEQSDVEVVLGAGKIATKLATVGKSTEFLVEASSVAKVLKSEELISSAGNVPSVASEIPDIGQAAVKGPLALTQSARAGFIALSVLFLGMDIFFVCKDSISLAKGIECELSQFIRARAALWSSEMDSWKKIRDSLCESLKTSEKNRGTLEKCFYPEKQN